MDAPPTASLAPSPDFRYVGLEPGPRSRLGLWASATAGLATLGAGLLHGSSLRGVLLTLVAAGAGALALRRIGGPHLSGRFAGVPAPMALVPWGILVDPEGEARVLRWAAVEEVHVEMLHGRDEGTSTTLWSVVTVAARSGERLVGRAAGAVPLERLQAHLALYAEEQARSIALDLDGELAAEDATEPACEVLLSRVKDWLASAAASSRLGLPPGGYRSTSTRAATERAVAVLGDVLRDRAPRTLDRRAFAAACAAELGAAALADELVALVQSPQPVVAAVAKVAARKVGVATARTGVLEELGPFLLAEDFEALRGWDAGA